ncbi:14535_t:CDS:2 [Ambispora leptoticha]|uniref:14535_t:CDS:1 n=1 Tax=Ambispora leptoticha TaxID=144679 RepID=A0A9N8VK97_9GLOM|nr:14535_t:CDS:2 [Ambispora leptoticha]
MTNGTIPPPNLYPEGRWTNNKTWVEYLAESLNVDLRDMAFGGATADNNIVDNENESNSTLKQKYAIWSSVKTQIDYFIQNATQPDKYLTTYMIWIGGNDYRIIVEKNMTTKPETIIASMGESLTRLTTSVGARKFLIYNLPPLEIAPLIQTHFTADQQDQLKNLVEAHNAQLDVMVKNFSLNYRVTARVFDLYNLTNEILNDPEKYQFKNVKDPCLNYYDGIFTNNSGINDTFTTNNNVTVEHCEQADTYLFWDRLHPTASAHRLLADKIGEYLKSPDGYCLFNELCNLG